MFKAFLTKIKDRLSHIDGSSWHWEMTEYTFGSNARGSACTYYWFKVPLSMLAHVAIAVVGVLLMITRLLSLSIMWVLGFRFCGKVWDLEPSHFEKSSFYDYKEKAGGSKTIFAPWYFVLPAVTAFLIWWLVYSDPTLGKQVLFWFGLTVGLVLLIGLIVVAIYGLTKAWKFQPVVKARANVHNAWGKVCPPLVVEDRKSK